jgi:hypothetical protein
MMVALASAGGAGAALIAGAVTGRLSDRRVALLEEELSDREAAGDLALSALDRARAEAVEERSTAIARKAERARDRATALVLSADRERIADIRVGARESIALVRGDRIAEATGSAFVAGSTVSAALPALSAILASQPRDRRPPHVAADAGGVFAVAFSGDAFAVARVDLEPPAAPADAIDQARRIVGSIAVPHDRPSAPGAAWPILLVAAILAAILAGVWASVRVAAPLSAALEAARDASHGRPGARAAADRGGRDARDVALAINALVDRADRALELGSASRGGEVAAAVAAIERLGKGDLRDTLLPGRPSDDPIAAAVERARKSLFDRVFEMHRSTIDAVTRSAEIGLPAKRISEASHEQAAALSRLGGAGEQATEEIRRKAAELEQAVALLSARAREHRRVIQDVRAGLSGLSRRITAIRGAGEEVREILARADSIDQALSMLSRLAGQIDVPSTRSRASALVGDSRAAIGAIGDRVDSIERDLLETARGLEALAEAQPEMPKDLDAAVVAPFYDAASILVRTVEMSVSCLTVVERSARATGEDGRAVHRAARDSAEILPKLGAALSAIRLGTSFEEQLLERLTRMQAEIEEARAKGVLTDDGQRMLKDVVEGSAAAKARLLRLVQATESAVDAMRRPS